MARINVVGAGLAGLSFALSAKLKGYEVCILDKASSSDGLPTLSSGVISINHRSRLFLEKLDVLKEIDKSLINGFSNIYVIDSDGVGEINFGLNEADFTELGWIIDTVALKNSMLKTARKLKIEIVWGAAFEKEFFNCDLLVAADGPNSAIREALGIRTFGYDYQQIANVCLVETENPRPNTAFQWFGEKGPLAFLPLSISGMYVAIWSSSENYSLKEENIFENDINARTGNLLGKISAVGAVDCFPLQQKHALTYFSRGAALIGDSAHTIHPLAGQGGNLGFADAEALAEEISFAELEGEEPGDKKILERYEKRRRFENRAFGIAMEGFHRMYCSDNLKIKLIRTLGMNIVKKSNSLKRLAMYIASGNVS